MILKLIVWNKHYKTNIATHYLKWELEPTVYIKLQNTATVN